ncbi:YbaB/EbfC family nucleoid-associated protein [Streptomyces sp. Qhu-G9]|uniref:YbaB/EbfC family nucleoid-associated protein n=1 Tax=Streptomyces sp. Qhu-G9 TaxID=3452799 RepID=UPI0022ABC831|nr:YbaB/EbfC family nucleoid-associated protein [Streptomyces aurantiacus]WAU82111.1 YbaB/EbfC family nucleoid-associated protein [Streptomyces aurantiacus]
MSESIDDRVAKAMAHLKATEEAVAQAQVELNAASVTARSADRSVRVAVGAKGELTSLEFLDGKYRSMAASQLAASVLEAANAARAEMARRVVATLDPLTRMTSRGLAPERMGVDWSSIFGSLLAETSVEKGPTPMSRLRDEIHEDEEEPGAPTARGTENKRQKGE